MGTRFTRLSPGTTNCYLLEADEGYLLVDTGYEDDFDDFREELRRRDVAAGDIEHLLLTHHHDDHAGFVADLLADTDPEIIAHEAAEPLLRTGENDKRHGGGYLNRRVYYLAKLRKLLNPDWDLTFPPVELRPDDVRVAGDDDEVLRERGIEGRILYTPGHTIDSISVMLDDGTTFPGDAAMSWPLWAGIRYCPVFVTDVDELYRSWEKLLDDGARTLYPAHGDPFDAERLRENLGAYDDDSLVEFF